MSALAVPVVLVDDHHMVVLGLRTLFHNRPEIDVVAFAHDAEEALARVRDRHPRVVVLDVALDGSTIDGFELCRRLRTEHEGVEVVFYTGVDELGLAERAFAAGAQGVVSKGDSAADLLKAVLLASRGRTYASPAFAARADHRDFEDLSPKQLAALRLLAQGLERKQIAEQMGVGEETVKSHLSEVRRKLGARTSAQAVAIGLINSLFEYDSEPAAAS
ncbi:response regulator transcription factor [Solirubrobacter soli]|uniref:response regulator transcription factor n=1 Tax=Solirubrobacter soli TaxID=363832 RepID=UPI00069FF834|nr:response regulator transcription factor [Solirubrobacter soli]